MNCLRSYLPLAAIVGLASLVHSANAQFEELAKQVPSSTNAIAFVNMEKLLASPAAIKGKWSQRVDLAYDSGVSFLPRDTKVAMLTMQMDFQEWMPHWEAALLEIDHEPSQAKAVEMMGGTADTVIGREAVALPHNAYLIKLATKTVAFMAPANRQTIARWMREIDARKSMSLSPYLTEAYGYANNVGTPIILALDLEDVVTPESLPEKLKESKEFLDKYKINPGELAALLYSIRGITLGITFDDKPFGKVRVDFSSDVGLDPDTAKAVLLHVLAKRGAMIDEFVDWKPSVKGKTFMLEGNLGQSGMLRISTLFSRPPSLKPREKTPDQTNKTKEQLTVEASQNYFKQINKLYSDLRSQKASNSTYTMPQLGVWMSKYAAKIDQLSVLNVDPELIDYGANAADLLRGGYNAIRTGAAENRVRQVNTPMQYNYYSYGNTYGYTFNSWTGAGGPIGDYGTYAVADTAAYRQARTAIHAEERVKAGTQARSSIQELEKATADIRKKMTIKYQVDF
ncbi:MAG: hypothetical protein K8R36_23975 [Planctomycetales bacterium]|nr:hypothetical protein [Planctomycetales bacterium]